MHLMDEGPGAILSFKTFLCYINRLLDQSWVFIGRTDAKTETPILWPPNAESLLIGKHPLNFFPFFPALSSLCSSFPHINNIAPMLPIFVNICSPEIEMFL